VGAAAVRDLITTNRLLQGERMSRSIGSAATIALIFVTSVANAQSRPAASASKPAAAIAKSDPVAEMRAGLRNLITIQEAYWSNHGSYTTDGAALGIYPTPKEQAVFVQVIFAGSRGWTAMATYRGLKGKSCVVYVGVESELPKIPVTSAEHLPAAAEAVSVCDTP
jgi:hypothetical protein